MLHLLLAGALALALYVAWRGGRLVLGTALVALGLVMLVCDAFAATTTLTTCADCRSAANLMTLQNAPLVVHPINLPAGAIIPVLPWYQTAEPYVVWALGLLAYLVVMILGGLVARKLHLDTKDSRIAAAAQIVEGLVVNGAGAVLAAQEGPIATMAIHAATPGVAAAANAIIAQVPDKLAAAGITPEAVAGQVLGMIGRLQVQASTPAIVVPAGSVPATGAPQ